LDTVVVRSEVVAALRQGKDDLAIFITRGVMAGIRITVEGIDRQIRIRIAVALEHGNPDRRAGFGREVELLDLRPVADVVIRIAEARKCFFVGGMLDLEQPSGIVVAGDRKTNLTKQILQM